MSELIILIIGFAIGWFIQSWISAQAFAEILKDLKVDEGKIRKLAIQDGALVKEEPRWPTVELKIEQVGDLLIAYRAKDDFFVAQGRDAAALIDVILHSYSVGHKIQIVEGGELVTDHLTALKNDS